MGLQHRYGFENTGNDLEGSANGSLVSCAVYTTGNTPPVGTYQLSTDTSGDDGFETSSITLA